MKAVTHYIFIPQKAPREIAELFGDMDFLLWEAGKTESFTMSTTGGVFQSYMAKNKSFEGCIVAILYVVRTSYNIYRSYIAIIAF